jgi:hypothetical protein
MTALASLHVSDLCPLSELAEPRSTPFLSGSGTSRVTDRSALLSRKSFAGDAAWCRSTDSSVVSAAGHESSGGGATRNGRIIARSPLRLVQGPEPGRDEVLTITVPRGRASSSSRTGGRASRAQDAQPPRTCQQAAHSPPTASRRAAASMRSPRSPRSARPVPLWFAGHAQGRRSVDTVRACTG